MDQYCKYEAFDESDAAAAALCLPVSILPPSKTTRSCRQGLYAQEMSF